MCFFFFFFFSVLRCVKAFERGFDMERKREKEENGGDKEGGRRKARKIDLELSKDLVGAAERGETERVRELLCTEGVDVHHAEGRCWPWKKTALFAASVEGHLETA